MDDDAATAGAGRTALLTVAGAGALVAVALGAYASVHTETNEAVFHIAFSEMINQKVWFATIAMALAGFQVFSALRIYGRLSRPMNPPDWFGDAHRLSGTLAFLFSLPVAYHCLWALGFQTDDTRSLVHSVLGCAFYGAFTVKVLAVRNHSLPSWALPVAGGGLFAVLSLTWATSAVWFWTSVDFPGF